MSTPERVARVATTLSLPANKVSHTVALLDEGNTVPFIARYRKERTGGLDEVQIRDVARELERADQFLARRQSILDSLAKQGALTAELRRSITEAADLHTLEDLYAPHRPRRTTRATRARQAGLEPVARGMRQGLDLNALARRHTSDAYPSVDEVLAGARDIVAEEIADDPELRRRLREVVREHGSLISKKRRGTQPDPTFELYLDFDQRLARVKPHQVLAIRRGEKEKALSSKLSADEERQLRWINRHVFQGRARRNQHHLELATQDGYQRLLFPAIARDVRGEVEREADRHAIDVFSLNLKNLLLQAPMPGKRVMGIDPGFRTGCKIAIVDDGGDVLHTDHVYVHDRRKQDAPARIARLVSKHRVELVAIGNGTASRETEEVVAEAIQGGMSARYAIVDEAGASVYSASELARGELPGLDVSLRGAVSIARRLQDPLAELIKIDPKSIGVGMYQHDVDQKELERCLEAVIEDVVHAVGVDLNTASPSLLSHVAGIGPTLAERIVAHRAERGTLRARAELKDVKGLGAKTFEQCAGFLRVRDGEEPLDDTSIHPEHYAFARAILRAAGAARPGGEFAERLSELRKSGGLERLAGEHAVGRATLEDIVEALRRPGRDPREELDAPQLRADVLSVDDLVEGMRLTGTVRNVVDFGAFVDIGLKNDGLVHVSELADRYVKNPHDVVSVGDRVEVVVLSVDKQRGRIGLSMKR
ncbi:MAG: Tex family protein [Myxococcota bacterium]